MNVLIYVLDCLRKDHLTVYGYSRETAPNISQLAMEGVIFDKAFSQATWTRPSAGSMLTGCYPTVHGAVTMQDCLSNKVPTLPSLLQNIGYGTAGFFANAQVSSFVGFNRGFEFYVDLFKEKEIEAQMLLQVHDELIFEVADTELNRAEPLIINVMQSIVSLSVPLVVEANVGDTWAEI